MLFLGFAMYCQASSIMTQPPTLLAGWEGSLGTLDLLALMAT